MLRQIFRKEKATRSDALIDAVLDEMHRAGVNSDEYPKLMTYLERLHDVKAKESRPTVSPDTIALIVGNLAGILCIVAYEQKHVMTSKGFSQLIRPRSETTN
jgi:hypothetical protein